MTRCLACNSKKLSHWTTARDIEYQSVDETFTLYRCEDCASLSIDPVPSDRLSEIYPEGYYSFQPTNRSLLQAIKREFDRRMFKRLCEDIDGQSLAALDVGGGTGVLLTLLREADARIDSTAVVDIDSNAEAEALAAGHAYYRCTIEAFEPPRQFDVVLMLNLIEHVADPLAVLAKVRDILRPGGVILIKTPNYDSLDERLFRRSSWGGYHCPRHWVLFTMPGFRDLVSELGLTVASASYTQGAPFWSVSIIGWMTERGLLASSRRPLYQHWLNGPLMAFFAGFDFLRAPISKTSQMVFILRKDA